MTNTKFRKRALLSAVAMLLVALVAIGSATFAWFTTSPEAHATGLQIKSTAGAGLEIKTATSSSLGWQKTAYFNFDKAAYDGTVSGVQAQTIRSVPAAFDIQPASFVGGDDFLMTTAVSMKDGTGADDADVAPANVVKNTTPNTALNPGVYCEQVDLQVTGGNAKVISLDTVTMSAAAGANLAISGVRILVTELDGTVVGYYAQAANDGNDSVFKAAHDTKSYGEVKADLGTLAINSKSTPVTLNGGTATASDSVLVYVFLNGFDTNVKSSVVNGADLLSSITLDFSIPV